MLIEFKKTQTPQKKDDSTKESPKESAPQTDQEVFYDKSGNLITKPELLAEIKRLKNKTSTQREHRRLYNILKRGDKVTNSTLAKATKHANPNKTQEVLHELNTVDQTKRQTPPQAPCNQTKINKVIELIELGNDPVASCKMANITYRCFLNEIEKVEFAAEKNEYLRARIMLADTYIYKINALQNKLVNGEIDPSTYSAISRDLLYLAGKFAPATFGDKISIENKNQVEVRHVVDQNKIASLNKLLALPNVKDAQFEEV